MSITETLAIEFLGAFLGAALGLIFLPPKTRFEFIRRFSLSLICGLVFGEPARTNLLRWDDLWTMHLAASAGVALLSWFAVGTAVRLVEMWKPPKGE